MDDISEETTKAEPPSDFLEHLEQRLGVRREAAFTVLADWIARYKPLSQRWSIQSGMDPVGSPLWSPDGEL